MTYSSSSPTNTPPHSQVIDQVRCGSLPYTVLSSHAHYHLVKAALFHMKFDFGVRHHTSNFNGLPLVVHDHHFWFQTVCFIVNFYSGLMNLCNQSPFESTRGKG